MNNVWAYGALIVLVGGILIGVFVLVDSGDSVDTPTNETETPNLTEKPPKTPTPSESAVVNSTGTGNASVR